MSRLAVISLLAASWLCVCHAQLGVSTEAMQGAVDRLSQRFYSLRNDGLGINSLEDALRGAEYTSQTLSDEDISFLLQNDVLENRISTILQLFDNITSAVGSAASVSASVPVSCCDAGAASADLCVYATSPSNASPVLNALLSVSLKEGEEVLVGSIEGTITQLPSRPPPDECTIQDARLKPWFAVEARQGSRPLEVVILLDLILLNPLVEGDVDLVRKAVSLILNSLTTADTVGLVGINRNNHLLPSVIERIHGSRPPRVVPVCTDTIFEIESFTTSFTPPRDIITTEVDYSQAFIDAFSLFSSNENRSLDQHLIYLTPGIASGIAGELTEIEAAINNSMVTISVYRSVDDGSMLLNTIATDGSNGVFTLDSPLASIVGGFYDIPRPRDCNNPVCTVTFGHANPGGVMGNSGLTLRRPLVVFGDFLGVLYAFLPFRELLSALLTATSGREFSYPFVVGANRLPLLHPLLPGESIAQVLITELEPEKVVAGVLDGSTSTPAPVTKQHLLYIGSNDFHSSTLLTAPSSYHCRELTFNNVVGVASTSITTCYVLAEQERTVRNLNYTTIDIQRIYQSRLPPIYHNILQTVPAEEQCNYFCKQSTTSRVSFQLTSPSSPPPGYDNTIITVLEEYIQGLASGPPDFVVKGVAEEAALGLAVAEDWLNVDSMSSDYLSRRHLATPKGLYLTYPPTHLLPEFQPLLSEWYQSPAAHPSLITLGTPQEDPLREGGRFTVSVGYAVRAPSSPSDSNLGDGGPPLAVVSGDITLDSLRVFMRNALPRCEADSVGCVIVDDNGNLIYERETANFNGEVRFFADEENRRVILTNLTVLARKRQCTDLFNIVTKTRRFFTLDTSSDGVFVNPLGHCAEYRVQLIPGTNAFLMVYEEKDCASSIVCSCSNTATCLNCDSFTPVFCECPCNCTDDCLPARDSSFICPLITPRIPMYGQVASGQISPLDPEEPFCFQQLCSCRPDFYSCFGVRDCHWCKTEQKCAHVTECCSLDEGRSCCGTAMEVERLMLYQNTCLAFAVDCFNHPVLNVTCPLTTPPPVIVVNTTDSAPSTSNASTIIAAVVGSLVGLILVVLIILLIIYYQVCRKPDPAEANSRESAFDFSNKTMITATGEVPVKKAGPKSPKRNSESADIEKGVLEEKQEVTPPKDTDETTM